MDAPRHPLDEQALDAAAIFASIIIPSLNQESFVADCLRSVTSQEGASFEIIFVDGGSTDATLEIAKPFCGAMAHFISEPDHGQADAINKGLRLARGELVTWLNADDFLEPGALAAMRDAAEGNSRAPFYIGLGSRTNREGTTRAPFYPANFRFNREALLWGLNYVLQPATFIRRAALGRIGGSVDSSLHYAFDTDLWIRLSGLGEPALVMSSVACSREYPETKTARGAWPRLMEIQQVAQRATGARVTPGVLAELMRLLHEQLLWDPHVGTRFPANADEMVMALWAVAAEALRDLSGRTDGFPVAEKVGGHHATGPAVKPG